MPKKKRERAGARPPRSGEPVNAASSLSLQLLIDSVEDYAIFLLDSEGHITTWNRGAERIKGYSRQEIVGKHFSCFYPAEDIHAGKPQYELEVASRVGRFEDEGWRLRKDGSRFWANVIITALWDADGIVRGFGKVTRDYTARMQAFEELRRAKEELEQEIVRRGQAEDRLRESERALRDLTVRLMRVQDEERRRIGRELHDGLGQSLAMLKLNLDLIDQLPESDTKGRAQQQADCLLLAERSIKEVRTISYLLYPPMLEVGGLAVAMQWYVDGFAKRSRIHTAFDAPRIIPRLPHEVELTIFRVLQEGLTNVHRHADSSVARVRFSLDRELACLRIEDEGQGISESGLEPLSRGVGLRGARELVQQLGGTLELSSTVGKGTTLLACLPCPVGISPPGVEAIHE